MHQSSALQPHDDHPHDDDQHDDHHHDDHYHDDHHHDDHHHDDEKFDNHHKVIIIIKIKLKHLIIYYEKHESWDDLSVLIDQFINFCKSGSCRT